MLETEINFLAFQLSGGCWKAKVSDKLHLGLLNYKKGTMLAEPLWICR